MAGQDYFAYNGERAREVSFPLGGIGTGSIGLSAAGRLIDWEVFNRPDKGVTNGISHFAVRAQRAGETIDARILHGPYLGSRMGDFPADTSRNFGFGARRDSLVGMPHFAANTFDGRYPVAELCFTDDAFPGPVRLTALNPFVPIDDRVSSMPVALFEIEFTNTTNDEIEYTAVCVLGHGLHPPTMSSADDPIRGIRTVRVWTDDTESSSPEYGELVVATDAVTTSAQTHLFRGHWFDALDVYWTELGRPTHFTERRYATGDIAGGMGRNRDSSLLAAHVSVGPGASERVRFALAWYVPVFHKYWISPTWHFAQPAPASGQWRNWYATQWTSAADVAHEALSRWNELYGATAAFRDALYGATLPTRVVDAAGANLSILRSPTTLRLSDGSFYGWEGCHPHAGSCEGSCTHVWNYCQALAYLFPTLERSMRQLDYDYNTDADGAMSFRLSLPLGTGNRTERPCVDGQFGNVMKLYRDWKLSGDTAWLTRLWPTVRRTIEYAWSEANDDRWDPRRTGVVWGRQHHTLDMELFGPNAWLTGFYLGALKAGSEMARAVGDGSRADEYASMFESGRSWVADHLFNGHYFIQLVDLSDESELKPYVASEVHAGLLGERVEQLYWSAEHGQLKYQIGDGCLTDQLVAQWHADLYGLGDLFDPAQVDVAVQSVFDHCFIERLRSVANPCRVFGVYDESGTIVASFPPDVERPAVPVPYAQETMHGIEYAFGQLLMSRGRLADGVRVVAAVRDRYDGTVRNPWNEIECGSNYARSLASWGAVIVLSGFSCDATIGRIGFAPLVQRGGEFRCPWSGPGSYGKVALRSGTFELDVLEGSLQIGELELPLGDSTGSLEVEVNGTRVGARFDEGVVYLDQLVLTPGDRLVARCDGISLDALPSVDDLEATAPGRDRAEG